MKLFCTNHVKKYFIQSKFKVLIRFNAFPVIQFLRFCLNLTVIYFGKICAICKKLILFSFLILTCRGDLGGTHRGKDVLVDVGRRSLEEVEGLLEQGSRSNLKDEVS